MVKYGDQDGYYLRSSVYLSVESHALLRPEEVVIDGVGLGHDLHHCIVVLGGACGEDGDSPEREVLIGDDVGV